MLKIGERIVVEKRTVAQTYIVFPVAGFDGTKCHEGSLKIIENLYLGL